MQITSSPILNSDRKDEIIASTKQVCVIFGSNSCKFCTGERTEATPFVIKVSYNSKSWRLIENIGDVAV